MLYISFECSSSRLSIRDRFSFIGMVLLCTALRSPLNVCILLSNISMSLLSPTLNVFYIVPSSPSTPIFLYLHCSISISTLLSDSSLDYCTLCFGLHLTVPCLSFHQALIKLAASTFNCARRCKRWRRSKTLVS